MKNKIKLSLIFTTISAGTLPLASCYGTDKKEEEIKAQDDFRLKSIANINNAVFDQGQKVYKISNTTKVASEIEKEHIKWESVSGKYSYTIDKLDANDSKGELEIFLTQKKGTSEISKFTIRFQGFYVDKFDEKLNFIESFDLKEKEKYTVKEYVAKFDNLQKLQSNLVLKTSNNKDLNTFLNEYEVSIKSITIEEISTFDGEANLKVTFENKTKSKTKEIVYKLVGFKKEIQTLEKVLKSIFDRIDVLEDKKNSNVFNYQISDLRYFKNNLLVDATQEFAKKGIIVKQKETDSSSYETDAFAGMLKVNITFGWSDLNKSETFTWSEIVEGFKEIKNNTELENSFNVDLKEKSNKTAQEYANNFNALDDAQKEAHIEFTNPEYQNSFAKLKSEEAIESLKFEIKVIDNFLGKVELIIKWQQWKQLPYTCKKIIVGFVQKESIEQIMNKVTNVNLSDKETKTVEEYISENKDNLTNKITATTPDSSTLVDYLTSKKVKIDKHELININPVEGVAKLKLTLSYLDKSQEGAVIEYTISGFKKVNSLNDDRFKNLINSLEIINSPNNYYGDFVKEISLLKLQYTNPDNNKKEDFNEENLKKLNISQIDFTQNLYEVKQIENKHKIVVNVKYTISGSGETKSVELVLKEGTFGYNSQTFVEEIKASLDANFDPETVKDSDLKYDQSKKDKETTTNSLFKFVSVQIDWPKQDSYKKDLQSKGQVRVKYIFINSETNKEYEVHDIIEGGKKKPKTTDVDVEKLKELAQNNTIFTIDKTHSNYSSDIEAIKKMIGTDGKGKNRLDQVNNKNKFQLRKGSKNNGTVLESIKLSEDAWKCFTTKKKINDFIASPSRFNTGHKAGISKYMCFGLDNSGKLVIMFSIVDVEGNRTDYQMPVE
ncbi:lipoprotein 17-related variable surface protein [Mycoplasmopsis caviae]|nr:lipoprotein 17-related variable surface protein [Mycoplasmopsis caviae]UUD34976.1 lipoprotein 17-related variable surface protein [Mycoplasmopsis caviae]